MSNKKTVVRVKIGTEEYSLRSDRSEEYTRQVAAHVDRALRDATSGGSVVAAPKAAILAALAITDELFQAQRSGGEMAERLSALTVSLSRLLPPLKRGRDPGSIATAPQDL
ncbi:MAG: cell division protein ZapA [Gemmatimonadetes bacterium]|nr:cell division protein ZapA [Gemmatimonadota bacterium]MCZ6759389.1 cell division protein ZapA [Gemmatimonadota bacterium]